MVYDVDRDGFISNGELFLVLKMMVGNNLKVRTEFDNKRVCICRANLYLSGLTITADCR